MTDIETYNENKELRMAIDYWRKRTTFTYYALTNKMDWYAGGLFTCLNYSLNIQKYHTSYEVQNTLNVSTSYEPREFFSCLIIPYVNKRQDKHFLVFILA